MSQTKKLFAILCLCLLVSHSGLAQELDEWDWANKHFPQVLDEVFPLDQEYGYSVSFRSYRELYTDVPEYYCSFTKDYQGNPIEVVVRMADTVSLYGQLLALHRENPSEGIDKIKKRLKFKEWRFTEKTCSLVKPLFEKFRKVRIPVPDDSTITLHPMIYSFRISGGDAKMKMELSDEDHPLVIWAKEARRALEVCATNIRGSKVQSSKSKVVSRTFDF